MDREDLYEKGWKLSEEPDYQFEGSHEVWYKGNPLSAHCIWLTRSLNSIRIHITYDGKLLLEGWLVRDELEELYFLLNKVVWKKDEK